MNQSTPPVSKPC